MYTGFIVATALCGFAPSYELLLAARIVAGVFGGVIGALVLAIVADVVPYARRARGNARSSRGVLARGGRGRAARAVVRRALLVARAVSRARRRSASSSAWSRGALMPAARRARRARPRARGPLAQLRAVFGVPNHLRAFAFMIALMLARLHGDPVHRRRTTSPTSASPRPSLPIMYFAGGARDALHRAGDRPARRPLRQEARVHDPRARLARADPRARRTCRALPLAAVVAGRRSLFFIFVPGRFGPAMALVTGSVEPRAARQLHELQRARSSSSAPGSASFAAGTDRRPGAGRHADRLRLASAGSRSASTLVAIVLALPHPHRRRRRHARPPGTRRAAGVTSSRLRRAPQAARTMIIRSLLDTDLYKFTMMQVVLHHFPGAQVEYRFKCRNAGRRPDAVHRARSRARSARCARCGSRADELDYLRRWRFFKSDFVDLLGLFQLDERFVKVDAARRIRRARSTSRSRARGCTRSCSRCRCSRSSPRSTTATTSPDAGLRRRAPPARGQDRAGQRGRRPRLPHRRLRHAPALLARLAGGGRARR